MKYCTRQGLFMIRFNIPAEGMVCLFKNVERFIKQHYFFRFESHFLEITEQITQSDGWRRTDCCQLYNDLQL
jgi:hypothetical protein